MTKSNSTNSNPTNNTVDFYGIYLNDKPLIITGSLPTGYIKQTANHITDHLNAVSTDNYTIKLDCTGFIDDIRANKEAIETALYSVLCNGESIQTHQTQLINNGIVEPAHKTISTAHTKPIAELIQQHLQMVNDDVYTLVLHTYIDVANGQQVTSYIDSWGV